jgi:hypothetical protein
VVTVGNLAPLAAPTTEDGRMAARKRSKLTDASGMFSTANAPEGLELGGVEGVHGELRRKPGPRPDPTKRELRKYLLKLKPEHAAALHKAALERALAGKDKRADAGGVLRLLLDKWVGQGAKAP